MSSRQVYARLVVVGWVVIAAPIGAEWLTVPAAAFQEDGQLGAGTTGADIVYQTLSGMVTITGSSPSGCFVAPVPLPDGAIVTAMRSVLLDTDPESEVGVQLMVRRVTEGPLIPIFVEHYSTGSSGIQTRTSTLSLAVDNSDRVYFLRVPSSICIQSALTGILAVQFEFTRPTIFADDFESGDPSGWSSTSP